jgi:hypothetical protein
MPGGSGLASADRRRGPGSASSESDGWGTPDVSCDGAANAVCDNSSRFTATQDSLAAALVEYSGEDDRSFRLNVID